METLKVSELRIGNYVKMDGLNRPIKVSIIDTTETSITTKCKPIPLTEEWLLNLGAKEINKKQGTIKCFLICGLKIDMSNSGNFYYKHKQIYAVHKLQNLVYELKDEELILNNK